MSAAEGRSKAICVPSGDQAGSRASVASVVSGPPPGFTPTTDQVGGCHRANAIEPLCPENVPLAGVAATSAAARTNPSFKRPGVFTLDGPPPYFDASDWSRPEYRAGARGLDAA